MLPLRARCPDLVVLGFFCLGGWVASGLLGAEPSSDWPQFRGPQDMRHSQVKGLPLRWSPRENLLWKVELPGAGTSSPVVRGTHLFLTAYRGFGVPGQRDGGDRKDLQSDRFLYCLGQP